MKTLFILSLIAVSSSQAFAADEKPSPMQMCGAAGVGTMGGAAVGILANKRLRTPEALWGATAAGYAACGAAAGATALYNEYNSAAPDEKELKEEPAQDSEQND